MNHRIVASMNALALVLAFALVMTVPASAQIPGPVDENCPPKWPSW